MASIRIIERPLGDAPEHIRSAWIGIVLPLIDVGRPQPIAVPIVSVLKRRENWLRRLLAFFNPPLEEQPVLGFLVDVSAALQALKVHDPAAALWWETNTPHVLEGQQQFHFDARCCSPISIEAN